MKYTIEGYSQEVAMALNLSIEDLVFLRWFIDFKEGGDMKAKYNADKNNMGYWVSYSKVVNDLPIMFATHPTLKEEWETITNDEQTILLKKWKKACREKVRRILSGNLSKVLTRTKEQKRNKEGEIITEIYITINPAIYKALISKTPLPTKDKNVIEETEPQKCGIVKTDTEPQKCGMDTEPQKCGINTSIIIPDSSITTHSADKPLVVENENVKLIESNTHLLLQDSPNKKSTVSKWNKDRLLKAIEIFKKEQGEYFSLLKKIYKDDKNFVPENNTNTGINASVTSTFKTKLHYNAGNEAFRQYAPDELEKLLKLSQQGKF